MLNRLTAVGRMQAIGETVTAAGDGDCSSRRERKRGRGAKEVASEEVCD